MIIRALHVEHWRCIGKLDLDGLETGIIILHGPNKTGKSSLVGAIRCCLFDLDHDVGNKLKKNIPWNGKGPPKVAIEFQTGSGEFRLTKVFSKRADGLALLEKKVGAEWQVEENSPKEASRKTREMLDADKSTGGLNQLLWLEQGEIGLPKSGDLDDSLERRLVSVLGVLVTGSDLAFTDGKHGEPGAF
ncbi:MAG TPA: ATP-binding protein [Gemmataceae bacterium]|jgi:predicted ATP-dependent endonuclease of OLD family|nr:ATP-binding protein [Gemmataceae bacterium]